MENRNGYRIANALDLRNRTQKELAQYLGVKPNLVSYWCNGERTPDIERIAKIAQFLDVSSDYLLGLVDTPETNKDIKAINRFTGLSEKAIINLAVLKGESDKKLRSFPPLLSMILGHRNLEYLMGLFEGYVYSGEERKCETLETMSLIEYRQKDFILAAINATIKDMLDEIAVPFLETNIPTEVRLSLKACEMVESKLNDDYKAGKISIDEYKSSIESNQHDANSIKKEWESKKEEIINGKRNPSEK